jgi:hypothetical protein
VKPPRLELLKPEMLRVLANLLEISGVGQEPGG